MSGRQRRRVVSVGAVSGVLVRRGDRWVLGNDSEVRVLEGLRGERGARDRLWALAAALDAGVVEAAGLRRLNGRLSEIAAQERPEDLWRVRVPGSLMAPVAYVCVCVDNEMLSRWLGFALAARLDANLVRGLLPGPSWVSWIVPQRRRGTTWNRDVHWISELPESFWARLAAHEDARLRAAAAASDPTARPVVLESLADQHWTTPETLDLVVSNPRTPTRVLRRIGQRRWGRPRPDLRVAQNRAATAGLLAELAKDDDWELRYVAAWHPKMPVRALRRLARDESGHVRAAVACNKSAPPDVLEDLASDDVMWVRRNVAWNPATPTDALEALLGDRLAVVRAAAVANASTPVALAAGRVQDRSLRVRQQVARRRGMGADTLTALAADPKDAVRWAVASNVQTPPDVLDQLATDPCYRVRGGVAGNRRTPLATLRRLTQQDQWLRTCVAGNPAVPAAPLAVLAADPSPNVRSGVAENAAAPARLLAALADDDDWYVRASVAYNPAVPPAVLEVLAHDPETRVRSCLCGNDHAPAAVVDALRTDVDYWVRAAAAAACEQRGIATTPKQSTRR